MRGTSFFVISLLMCACGGAEDSLLFDGGGTTGGDGGNGGDTSTGDSGPQSCDVSRCATIPSGFRAVRLSDTKTACPSGWDSKDVVSNPVASADACTCDCNVTQQPDCNGGNVTRHFDDTSTPTCTTQATTFPGTNGACAQIGANLILDHAHYAVTAPPPAGGQCQYDSKFDSSKVSGTPGRVCAPPTSCVGAICDGPVCVAQDGDVDCPSSFPTKTLVGSSATAKCGSCGGGCNVGGECTGTIRFFTDLNCSLGEVDFTADGVCKTNVASTTAFYTSYSYMGSVSSATCAGPAPTSQAEASLDDPATVCCKN